MRASSLYSIIGDSFSLTLRFVPTGRILRPADMFTGMRAESGVLDAAALRQQRRLKQAIQFLHKDSADLLPLDGLKKLGTSNQGQPHHILQKRLLEAKLSRGQMSACGGVVLTRNHLNLQQDEDEDEEDLIYVPGKCSGRDVNVLLDTGCPRNLLSSVTVQRLGLKELLEDIPVEAEGVRFQRNTLVDGHIRELSVTVGQLRITSSFAVVESNRPLMSLGSRTLKSLQSVIDTEKQMLVFGTHVREQVPFVGKSLNERSTDFRDLGY